MRNIPQQVVIGDDAEVIHYLFDNGRPLRIGASATVTCRLVSLDRQTAYTESVAQTSTDKRNDWIYGKVLAKFSQSDTESISFQGMAFLETQVQQNSLKKTSFTPIELVNGLVA